VIDPRRQALSRHAVKHLAFKPGSDVAMLNAMINTIITEGLTDEQYIAGYTEGFEELKAKIKDFTPEKMAPICDIPAETLREVARMYARAKSSIIFWGMGISQHVHGTDNARCLIALALITGQVGRPGTGLHPLRGQNNVQGASDAGLIPMFLPDYQPVGRIDLREPFEKLWHQQLDPVRGLTVVEIMNAIHAGEINGMYIEGRKSGDVGPRPCSMRARRWPNSIISWCRTCSSTRPAFHADVHFAGLGVRGKNPAPSPTPIAACNWRARSSSRQATPGRISGSSRKSRSAWGCPGTMPARPMSLPR